MRELPFDLMSVRLSNCLKKAGILSYENLKEKTRKDILQTDGMGRISVGELEELLCDQNSIYCGWNGDSRHQRSPAMPFFKNDPPKERQPMKARYIEALKMRKAGKKFREIADHLSVTTERARQIVVAAEKREVHQLRKSKETP